MEKAALSTGYQGNNLVWGAYETFNKHNTSSVQISSTLPQHCNLWQSCRDRWQAARRESRYLCQQDEQTPALHLSVDFETSNAFRWSRRPKHNSLSPPWKFPRTRWMEGMLATSKNQKQNKKDKKRRKYQPTSIPAEQIACIPAVQSWSRFHSLINHNISNHEKTPIMVLICSRYIFLFLSFLHLEYYM